MKYIALVLFAVFIFLKLAELGKVAAWSWWWVTAPIWIYCCIWIVLFCLAVMATTADKTPPKRRPMATWEEKLEEMQKRKTTAQSTQKE